MSSKTNKIEVTYVDHMGDDRSVVNAARVSFNKYHSELDQDRDPKLIRFLATHRHWTPFGHTCVTLHVKAPFFVRTQCYKHKVGLVENEVSRRYVTKEPEFYRPFTWRSAPKDKKQGSGEDIDEYALWWTCPSDEWEEATSTALEAYHEMLDCGVAPEQARMVLPECTMTEWYWSGSIAAFSRVHSLRSASDAQKEIQDVARQIDEIIAPLFPYSWRELVKKDA